MDPITRPKIYGSSAVPTRTAEAEAYSRPVVVIVSVVGPGADVDVGFVVVILAVHMPSGLIATSPFIADGPHLLSETAPLLR